MLVLLCHSSLLLLYNLGVNDKDARVQKPQETKLKYNVKSNSSNNRLFVRSSAPRNSKKLCERVQRYLRAIPWLAIVTINIV